MTTPLEDLEILREAYKAVSHFNLPGNTFDHSEARRRLWVVALERIERARDTVLSMSKEFAEENKRLSSELAAAQAVGERDFCRVVYLGNRASPLDTAEREELDALLRKAYKILTARGVAAEPKEADRG